MSTTSLTRGYANWIQAPGNNYSSNAPGSSGAGDWVWFIGRRYIGYANDFDAAAVAFTVPTISDALLNRKITIPCSFQHNIGAGTARAVLSTQAPSGTTYKNGPTSGIISKEITFSHTATSLTFTLTDGVGISGKTIYLYLYAPASQSAVNAVVTQSFGDATLTYYAPYKLTISAGTGSTITVKRISSGAGATGNLSNGATLYHGDVLQISFAAASNYQLLTHTVNGDDFDSGESFTVTGNVTAAATAQALASTIGATDANVGSVSTITVSRKSNSYTHSIQFTFGRLTGYITADGGVSDKEVKLTAVSIAFRIPVSFYDQIPNVVRGTCTLTCKTYSGSKQIGETKTAEFTAIAPESVCKPTVSGTVVDSNEVTKALTGNENVLIRYFSTALCTMDAEAKNSATLALKQIGGTAVTEDTRSIPGIEADKIAFYAKDSRGYAASVNVAYELVPYVRLTNNSEAKRDDPTSGKATLTIRGDFFNDTFGDSGAENALTVKYRVNGGEYQEVSVAKSGNSYSAVVALTDLDYKSAHTVEVVASDSLDEVSKEIPIKKGIPIFDYGKDDFRINVFFRLAEENGYGSTLPKNPKRGQVFLLISGNTLTIKLYDGTSWI